MKVFDTRVDALHQPPSSGWTRLRDPEPGGALRIMAVSGDIMTLQRADGSTIFFDIASRWFVGYPTPTATPAPTATPGPAAAFSIVASASAVAPGEQFSITVMQDSSIALTGAQTDFAFDPDALQVISVELGDAYRGAVLIYGVAPDLGAAAIADANRTGMLNNIAAYFVPLPGRAAVPPGQHAFLKIDLRATSHTGVSDLRLSNLQVLDTAFDGRSGTGSTAQVTVQSANP